MGALGLHYVTPQLNASHNPNSVRFVNETEKESIVLQRLGDWISQNNTLRAGPPLTQLAPNPESFGLGACTKPKHVELSWMPREKANRCFDVTRKCTHCVRFCKRCRVIPIEDHDGNPLNYLVEHYDRNAKFISCTIGKDGVEKMEKLYVTQEQLDLEAAETLRTLGLNIPEQGSSEPIPSEVIVDAELRKMHLEESVITEPGDTEHLQSTIGSQMEQVQSQMKASFSTPVVKRASRCLEQLVLLVVGLQYDTSLEAIVLRCVQFLSAITEGGIVLTLKDTLMKYASTAKIPKIVDGKSIKEIFEVEKKAAEPEMLSAESLKVWETLKQGVFTKHLSYILGTVFAFSACKIKNVKFNHPVFEKVVEHASADEIDGMDLIDHAIKLYNWTSTVGMACLESRSFEPMMVNSTTLAKCHEKYYHWLKKFQDFKRTGSSTMEERQLMYVEVETILKTLERFTKCQREKYLTLQSSSLHKEVISLFSDVRDFVCKIDRVKVAEAYHLTGVPKIGKSEFTPLIAEQICLARGVEYRSQDNAQINLMAPYQDELNNSTQIITINETMPIKAHFAKSLENAYNTSLALVDPVPYHPNRSSLEDKAKITMTHIGVISTGNTDQPFLHAAQTPGAWERRYPIIHMKVKEEFADEFGRLDTSAIDGSNDYHLFDMYEIVYENGNKKIVYFTYDGKKSIGLDTREILDLVRQRAIRHFAEQDKKMNEHNKETRKGCLKCQRVAMFCNCSDKDAQTLSGKSIRFEESSVVTPRTLSDQCPFGDAIGHRVSVCVENSDGYCMKCGRQMKDLEEIDSQINEPEMGLVGTAISTVGSLAWSSLLPWINPFNKMKYLWSIDNNTMKVFHEEIVEELSYWPDYLGTTVFRLLPEHWERTEDGELTWFGKKKDSFLRMVAAEKQIFLPLHYLLRRAFFIGLIMAFVTLSFGYCLERYGLNPREYEAVEMREYSYSEWGWYYLYPQYSDYVMQRREIYAQYGVFTEQYLHWKKFYVDMYFFQKILGKICIPWYFTYTKMVPVLVMEMYEWWFHPMLVTLIVTIALFFYMWWRRWLGYQTRYQELQKRCMSDPNLQRSIYEKARRHPSEYNALVPTAIGVVGAIVAGLAIWNNIRSVPEGAIERDSGTVSWNDWFSFNRQTPVAAEPKNHSPDEAVNVIDDGACEVDIVLPNKDKPTRKVKGQFTRPGVLLLPRHIFKVDPYKDEIHDYVDLKISMKNFKTQVRVYEKSFERIPGKDAVLVKVHKAPRMKRGCEHLLPKKTGSDSFKCKLLYMDNGQLCQESLNAKYENNIDCGGFSCGRGLSYTSRVTKEGFCGSVLLADRRDGPILGFHISGRPNGLASRLGYAQEITFDEYQQALHRLEQHVDYISTPEMGDLVTSRLGHELVPNKGTPHPETKVFEPGFMNPYNGFQVVGHDLHLPKYRSRVRKSMISDSLEKHTGQKCRWKCPYLKKSWIPHNAALQHIAEGAREVPPESAQWACDDFYNHLHPILVNHMAKYPDLCRVLTQDEAINGVKDGLYMGPWKINSAPGIGTGDKVKAGIVEQMDPYPDGRKRYKLTKEAQKYYDDMLQTLKSGKLLGIYVKSCLKDEVVPEDSEKVRIFYIMECIFGLICRQIFLPIAEFMSRHPLESECAVGINCAGPEWEKLQQHLERLTTDGKLTDWDYSKYDLKRSIDVMCMSLKICIRFATLMMYSDDWLCVMRVCSEEMRNPLMNWNGTIIFMFLWTSGNIFTVYGNSIENSLHQRISFHWNGVKELGDAFYSLGTFRENESIITYGDDGNSGCSVERRSICGFKAKKRYFDFIGMKITDARKSAEETDAIPISEIDFLKRKSVYHPELGCRVGALHEESIWKMGHMHSGSGEDEDLAIAGIMSMLTESFLHGKEFYEKMRLDLQKCARDVNIWTDKLEVTYSEKVAQWHEKYD